jgi:hypothetical protein
MAGLLPSDITAQGALSAEGARYDSPPRRMERSGTTGTCRIDDRALKERQNLRSEDRYLA